MKNLIVIDRILAIAMNASENKQVRFIDPKGYIIGEETELNSLTVATQRNVKQSRKENCRNSDLFLLNNKR